MGGLAALACSHDPQRLCINLFALFVIEMGCADSPRSGQFLTPLPHRIPQAQQVSRIARANPAVAAQVGEQAHGLARIWRARLIARARTQVSAGPLKGGTGTAGNAPDINLAARIAEHDSLEGVAQDIHAGGDTLVSSHGTHRKVAVVRRAQPRIRAEVAHVMAESGCNAHPRRQLLVPVLLAAELIVHEDIPLHAVHPRAQLQAAHQAQRRDASGVPIQNRRSKMDKELDEGKSEAPQVRMARKVAGKGREVAVPDKAMVQGREIDAEQQKLQALLQRVDVVIQKEIVQQHRLDRASRALGDFLAGLAGFFSDVTAARPGQPHYIREDFRRRSRPHGALICKVDFFLCESAR